VSAEEIAKAAEAAKAAYEAAFQNAWLYTFSTIAQTLGAIVAIYGAVLLFRLQSWGTEAETAATHAWEIYQPQIVSSVSRDEAIRFIRSGNIEGLASYWLANPVPRPEDDPQNPISREQRILLTEEFEARAARLQGLIDWRKAATSGFHSWASWTSRLIAFSVFCLAFTHASLSLPLALREIVLLVGTGWFFERMWCFVDLLKGSVK
jgi:hypothetical protein